MQQELKRTVPTSAVKGGKGEGKPVGGRNFNWVSSSSFFSPLSFATEQRRRENGLAMPRVSSSSIQPFFPELDRGDRSQSDPDLTYKGSPFCDESGRSNLLEQVSGNMRQQRNVWKIRCLVLFCRIFLKFKRNFLVFFSGTYKGVRLFPLSEFGS